MPKGNWIATITGKHVYPLDFRPEMIDIEDICHALSNLCRFTGHVRRFYSVAEHSVLMAQIIQERYGNAALTLQALLHDAPEAYLNDLPNPLKQTEEFAFYKVVEQSIEQVLFPFFSLPPRLDPRVKALDAAMLLAEGRFFFEADVDSWTYPPKETTERLEVKFHCWNPSVARNQFTTLFAICANKLQLYFTPSSTIE